MASTIVLVWLTGRGTAFGVTGRCLKVNLRPLLACIGNQKTNPRTITFKPSWGPYTPGASFFFFLLTNRWQQFLSNRIIRVRQYEYLRDVRNVSELLQDNNVGRIDFRLLGVVAPQVEEPFNFGCLNSAAFKFNMNGHQVYKYTEFLTSMYDVG